MTKSTTFWIETWGGDGGDGNVCCDKGGPGGKGGYAQIITTLDAFETAFSGQQDIYYYLGFNGTSDSNAGGDGCTATTVTVNDLFESDMTLKDTLLLAGGGGGGGAGRGKTVCYDSNGGQSYVFGETGGDSGAVIVQSVSVIVSGMDGSNGGSGRSGYGGQPDQGGAPGFGSDFAGGDPIATMGGVGGMHSNPQVGFVNASTLQVGGAGGQGQGDSEYYAGGGGGGGGYTGGGGGVRAFGETCVSGAGGGGSSYAQALPDSPTCSAVPTEQPSNPAGGEGYIRITFDLGACE